MRYRHLLSAVGFAAALGWGTAQADMLSGGTFYVGGEAGWTNLEDQRVTVTGIGSGTARFDDGYNAGGRAGMMWGPWRLEEEFTYRHNDFRSIAGVTARGSARAVGFMTNLIYDFQVNWPVTPHIGAGIGAVNIEASVNVPGANYGVKSNDWEFGYQAIAGIRYNINPSLAFDLDYRYLATTDPSFRTTAASGLLPVKAEYSTHNVVASLTFLFNAPPPPAPMPVAAPAPPPPQPKVFLVFFDWDRDTITPEGMKIIQQAADAYKSGAPVRIMVTGYTDRSGSPGYNQRLSERRANNVANALARMGVPREQMAVSGRGENDNRVPTADGVREPQNRRVEIVFP